MPAEVPELFAHWERLCGWLLARTEKFPKRVRFTFTTRIDNLALDVFERIVEARYTRERAAILARINLDLEKLRLLLRLVHEQRVLDARAFSYACREIDAAGRMVGGWLRHVQRAQGV
jgi:hypothetical protein